MYSNLSEVFDRPIAFHRSLVDLTGSINAALMLSQAIYWSKRTKSDCWFYKTKSEWEDETGLTRTQQATARGELRAKGFWLEELRGMPAKLHFKISQEKFDKSFVSLFAGNLQTSMQVSRKQVCRFPANKYAGNLQTFLLTETTTETTTGEGSAEAAPPPPAPLFDLPVYTRLLEIYGLSPKSKSRLAGQLKHLSLELADVDAQPNQVEAFFTQRTRKPPVACFLEDFLTWRAGITGKGQNGKAHIHGNSQDHAAILSRFRPASRIA